MTQVCHIAHKYSEHVVTYRTSHTNIYIYSLNKTSMFQLKINGVLSSVSESGPSLVDVINNRKIAPSITFWFRLFLIISVLWLIFMKINILEGRFIYYEQAGRLSNVWNIEKWLTLCNS